MLCCSGMLKVAHGISILSGAESSAGEKAAMMAMRTCSTTTHTLGRDVLQATDVRRQQVKRLVTRSLRAILQR